MSDWPYLAIAAAAAAVWVALKVSERRTSALSSATPSPATALPQVTTVPRPGPNFVSVLTFDGLVQKTGIAGRLAKIQQKLGFAPENFARDVSPLLQKFAEYVQLLPASESHHHAQPGGLLIHLIEVAEYALHFRDSYKLPIGASTEEQMRLAARYSYAVLIAALLHDIGKPVADVTVQVVDAAGGSPHPWVALAGAMKEQGVSWYAVDFPTQRDYAAHRRLPVILLQRFVPDPAITWLGESKDLLQELMDYLSGDRAAGSIAEIVSKADQKSVADNLLSGPRTRFASARAIPLIERLMTALRRILTEGVIPLNRAGATGYCDGEYLWCVAGSIAKAVREYLNQNETREPGAAGVPDDNNRLFDTWQEYGALVPTAAGGAIWNIKVRIAEWEQSFTVLRFPLAKLYARPDLYPLALPANAIQSVDTSPASSTTATADAVELPSVSAGTTNVAAIAIPPTDVSVNHAPAAAPASPEMHADAAEVTTEPPAHAAHQVAAAPALAVSDVADDYPVFDETPAPTPQPPAAADYLDENESAHSMVPPAAVEVPATVQAPIKPKDRRSRPSADSLVARASNAKPRPNAERFMAWIQQGVGNGELLYNESSACIHFVQEGMFVLSPKAFQEYARLCPDAIDIDVETSKPVEPWRVVQRDFQRSTYPQKAPKEEGGTYLYYYTVSGPAGKRLAGLLVAEPGRFFNPVPAANSLLKR